MSKSTCCSICLSTNRRTINIYGTILQYTYENLAYYKITGIECWMCYICHTRLQQCHQLRLLAMQTRGRTEFLHNKVEHEVRSVLKLSTSRIMTISTVPDVKTEDCIENELEAEQIDNEVENMTYIKSKCASTENVLEYTFEEISYSETDEYDQYPTTNSEHAKVKQERPENIQNKGEEQNIHIYNNQTQDVSKAETKELHKCDVCSKKFAIKSLLVIHSRTHTGEIPFRCDVCFKNFKYKSHLLVHKQKHAGYRPYTCDICSKQFSYKNSLTAHKRVHNRPYSCAVCPKSFTQKSNLSDHMRVHTGDKPYICDVCSKQYVQMSHLQRHLFTHSKTKAFSCEVCSKKFTQKRYLESHSFVHTRIKNYICDICAKKFSRKCELNKHKRIHTGYKPYNCDICSKSFLWRTHLNRHVLTHTGEKPFTCDKCLKKFSRKGYLKVHIQSVCARD